MNSKILIVLLIAALSVINAQNKTPDKQDLEWLINKAISVSPEIKMLEAKYRVAKSQIEIGTNLPDPVLTLGLANLPVNSFSFTQEPMTGKVIGLTQAIPFPGALSSAAGVKAVDTSIIRQNIIDLKNKIRKEVAGLYFSLQFVRENIRFANESIGLLKQISDVVRQKYDVGSASLQNLVQVEVQITRVKDKIESLKSEERALLAKLNAYLLRNGTGEIQTGKIQPIKFLETSTESLVRIATENRPQLQSLKLSVKKAQLMKEQAEYSFYPNFKLGLQYSQRDYSSVTSTDFVDFFSVLVGISLPINYGGKKTEQVNRAVHLGSLYNEQYNLAVQKLQQTFGTVNSKLLEMFNREELITDQLLPQAQQAYKAAIADYQVGKIDFANVIKAENDILNIKTELAKIRTDYYKNLFTIEYLAGTELINIEKNRTETNDEE